jgi:hypothetical protein
MVVRVVVRQSSPEAGVVQPRGRQRRRSRSEKQACDVEEAGVVSSTDQYNAAIIIITPISSMGTSYILNFHGPMQRPARPRAYCDALIILVLTAAVPRL